MSTYIELMESQETSVRGRSMDQLETLLSTCNQADRVIHSRIWFRDPLLLRLKVLITTLIKIIRGQPRQVTLGQLLIDRIDGSRSKLLLLRNLHLWVRDAMRVPLETYSIGEVVSSLSLLLLLSILLTPQGVDTVFYQLRRHHWTILYQQIKKIPTSPTLQQMSLPLQQSLALVPEQTTSTSQMYLMAVRILIFTERNSNNSSLEEVLEIATVSFKVLVLKVMINFRIN